MINVIKIIKKRKSLLLIIIPLILLAVNNLLTTLTSLESPQISPTPRINIGPTAIHNAPMSKKSQTNPPILYNSESSKKMLDKLKNRTPLSIQDENTKQRIIRSINNRSSVLRTAPTFRVEYLESPDIFMVEIRTVDIGRGKLDAKNWLISQGFTEQGACELPVVYYLNGDVASQLRNLDIIFSPLASGC